MAYAYFDEDGICLRVTNAEEIDTTLPFYGEVEDGTKPNTVYYSIVNQRVKQTTVVTDLGTLLSVPDILPIGTVLKIFVPENCVIEVNGIRYKGKVVYNCSEPTMLWVRLLGAQTGEKFVNVNSYVEDRKAEYPTPQEQFDMLYHLGYDGWKAVITAIKEKYPKPE